MTMLDLAPLSSNQGLPQTSILHSRLQKKEKKKKLETLKPVNPWAI